MNEEAENLNVTENEENSAAQDSSAEPIDEVYDIDALLAEDLAELKEDFAELKDIGTVSDLPNATRYAALRDLGLTPTEAYRAVTPAPQNTRAHLKSSLPKRSRPPVTGMSSGQWQEARELFEDMSDSEIEKLYKTVTK